MKYFQAIALLAASAIASPIGALPAEPSQLLPRLPVRLGVGGSVGDLLPAGVADAVETVDGAIGGVIGGVNATVALADGISLDGPLAKLSHAIDALQAMALSLNISFGGEQGRLLNGTRLDLDPARPHRQNTTLSAVNASAEINSQMIEIGDVLGEIAKAPDVIAFPLDTNTAELTDMVKRLEEVVQILFALASDKTLDASKSAAILATDLADCVARLITSLAQPVGQQSDAALASSLSTLSAIQQLLSSPAGPGSAGIDVGGSSSVSMDHGRVLA